MKGLYPPWYQKKIEAWKRGETDWDGKPLGSENASEPGLKLENTKIGRLLVYLRLDSLPSLFTFVSLLGAENEDHASATDAAQNEDRPPTIRRRPLEVHALRIVELTERTSSVMKITESDEYSRRDPVVNAFKTFSQLHNVAVSSSVVVAPEDSYAQTVVNSASDQSSDFVLIPWSEVGSNTEDQSIPFHVSNEDRFSGRSHLEFIQNTLSKAVCNTGIFIGNGFSGIAPVEKGRPNLSRSKSGLSLRSLRESALPPVTDKTHHVFLPFIGGEDDRAALHFVLQLAKSPLITVTVAHLNWTSDGDDEITSVAGESSVVEAKDNIKTEITAQDTSLLSRVQSSLSANIAGRINFVEVSVSTGSALNKALEMAKNKTGQNPRNSGDIVIAGRRHAKLSKTIGEGDISKTLGVLGEKFTLGGLKASVLVIQAGSATSSEGTSYA